MAIKIAGTEIINDNKELVLAKLTEINSSINSTAVDVFIYDTSKDSDGGAWRHRTQHTSWYAEASSASRDENTRSTRAEFPAVAVIVAESNKVTIYDGDDPSLPMWMVFNYGTTGSLNNMNMLYAQGTSVTALNGVICTAGDQSWKNGLVEIKFVSDTAFWRDATYVAYWGLDIANRNVNGGYGNFITTENEKRLVNNSVNEVAMTVLPDAPTDPATGLPVPTIAVATDGGVSVIKDDGTVVDITGIAFQSVGFISSNRIWGEVTPTIQYGEIPTADISYSSWRDGFYNDTTGRPYLRASATSGFAGTSVGQAEGLSIFDENIATPANGMVAYTTSTYTTGWMNGDIKLAALADTDDTDLNPAEEVVDSTFDNAASWTTTSGVSIAGGEAVWNAAVTNDYVLQNSVFTTGLQYKITVTVSSYTSGDLRGRFGGAATDTLFGITGTGTYTVIGSATGAALLLVASESTTLSLSDVSVKLLDQDRSVNGKGLGVHGSITKEAVATGADVVGYSGFSSSNYLEQPYNSDLDFGTGDFSVMGWVKIDSGAGGQWLVIRGDTSFSSHFWYLTTTASGYPAFRVKDASTQIGAETTTDVRGSWAFLAGVKDGDTIYTYINGVSSGTNDVTSLGTLDSGSSAILRMGHRMDDIGAAAPDTSLALLRISATAPTAEQIRKIYEDERPLFQENAKATLTGSSDAVTALAHDPDTNLLHVGTSGGRSVFQGLRRVEEHTGTNSQSLAAISAVDGLVVEGK